MIAISRKNMALTPPISFLCLSQTPMNAIGQQMLKALWIKCIRNIRGFGAKTDLTKAKKINLSPQEVSVLASIVQAESNKAVENLV